MPNSLPNNNPLSYLGVKAETPPNLIHSPVAPTAHDINHDIGTIWVDTVTNTVYVLTSILAGAATWTVVAAQSGGTPPTPFVVGPTGGYATVQLGVNAAHAAGGGVVYVQPGTYVENLTLYTKIAIVGFDAINTVITGVHTPPAAGNITFLFVTLTSATNIFNSAAAGTTRIVLNECDVRVTNGYCFNLVNWTGELDVFSSTSVLGTNDGFVNNTGGATVFVINSDVGFGAGNAAVMTGVRAEIISSSLNCPATIGGAGTLLFTESCEIFRTLTTAGTATVLAQHSVFETGATAAISHGSAGILVLENCTIVSSNNPSLAGAGAGVINLNGVAFTSNAAIAGTLTVTKATAFDVPTLRANDITSAGAITATTGAITATNGNLVLGTAGNKIRSTSVGAAAAAGANSFGTVTLVGGTVVVSTTAVTANSIIMLTRQSIGATGAAALGMLSVGTIVAGTSFVISALTTADATTALASDVSVIGWMIIN